MDPTKTITIKTKTPEQAKLKDSLMLIRLMYEDMIKHEVNTKSRDMAGRFLYSNGYDQIVKELQS